MKTLSWYHSAKCIQMFSNIMYKRPVTYIEDRIGTYQSVLRLGNFHISKNFTLREVMGKRMNLGYKPLFMCINRNQLYMAMKELTVASEI